MALNCIACKKELTSAGMPDAEYNQPNDGVAFSSLGNYGSKIWDEGGEHNPRQLEISVCDDCLIEAADAGMVMTSRKRVPPTTWEYAFWDVPLDTRLWQKSKSLREYNDLLIENGLPEIEWDGKEDGPDAG